MKSLKGKVSKLMYLIRSAFESHSRIIAFFIVFAFIAYYNVIHKAGTPFYYDSGQYWSLQYSFTREGVWSLLHYDNALRGYLLPLVFYTISAIAGLLGITDTLLLGLVKAIVYSAGITIAMPFIVEKLFHRKVTLSQIWFFAIFVIIFWRGYFYYPLADFTALFSIIFGLYLVLLPSSRIVLGRGPLVVVSLVFAGMLWAAATNIRPSYLIALAPLVGWSFLYNKNINKYPLKKCVSLSLAVLLGMFIALYPQYVINAHNFDKHTPFVLAELEGRNLYLQQLNWGIIMQKYETNVGTVYPVPPVRFFDLHGKRLIANVGAQPKNLGEYIELVLQYPTDFAVIYARRLFNGLDVTYHSAYTSNILQNAIGIRLINYSILFLALWYLVRKRWRNFLELKMALPFILVLPSLVAIPTAIEVRFMLPLFFIIYTIVSYFVVPEFLALWRDSTQKGKISFPSRLKGVDVPIKWFVFYILFLVICFTLSMNAFMGLEFGNYLLHAR